MQGLDAATEVWSLMGRAVVDLCGELGRQAAELAAEGERQPLDGGTLRNAMTEAAD